MNNIVSHDIKYLKPYIKKSYTLIDTLYMSERLTQLRFLLYYRRLSSERNKKFKCRRAREIH